jgi:3-deoxy-7-phosphoheptulonate synthase
MARVEVTGPGSKLNTATGAELTAAKNPPKTKTVTVRRDADEGSSIIIGGRDVVVIAGPCSIESESHLRETAMAVGARGASLLRGGVFKMRTSPESFQGIGTPAFEFLGRIKTESHLPMVSEITDPRQIEMMLSTVDVFQVGSRNMYNYELLKELGRIDRPVILKRAFAATIDEWIHAAEYTVRGGNDQVILCERGIRTFETATRNTLDLNAVAWIKAHTDFAVIVDPSHGTGRRELVMPMALAGIAAGADGVICEVHPRPDEALSDSFQALDFDAFEKLVEGVATIGAALGRPLFRPQAKQVSGVYL